MKKLLLISSMAAASLSLIGCHTMNNMGEAGGEVTGAGVKVVSTTGKVIGTTGKVIVDGTGRVISGTGQVIGTTVDRSARFVTGNSSTTYNDTMGQKATMVKKNGHTYKMVQGKYVLVH